MKKPICLFDSGIGGLTVLKKLIEKFPTEEYIYFSDLARVPFGDKTKEEVKAIANEIIDWLLKFEPKTIIMACNASSAALSSELSAINNKLNIPIFGIIDHCTKEITKSNYRKVSVWTTKVTAESNAYKTQIKSINPNIFVEEIQCPKLVPMIESLKFTLEERDRILSEYLDLTSKDTELIVLGCTHYPLILEDIKSLTKKNVMDPADSLVKNLKDIITPTNNKPEQVNITLYTTAQKEKLERFSRLYLDQNTNVNLVTSNKVSVKS